MLSAVRFVVKAGQGGRYEIGDFAWKMQMAKAELIGG